MGALFHSVSGLKCNLDKTFVVPVGNFRKDNLCSDLQDLKWVDEFKVLGIVIDNKLKRLRANFSIQYTTIQYNTIHHNTIQYNTIQYTTIQYNTIQYNPIQYNTIQYNTIQYNTIQYNTIQ